MKSFQPTGEVLAENAKLRQLLAQAESAVKNAQEDNAMLLGVLRQLDYSDPAKAERLLARVRDMDVPGRMLMAEYMTNIRDLKEALERERSAVSTAQDLVDHYRALTNRHAEDLKATQRRLDRERGVAQGMIEALRSVLPAGDRGDNRVWACEKIADYVADLRGQVESATERALAAEAQLQQERDAVTMAGVLQSMIIACTEAEQRALAAEQAAARYWRALAILVRHGGAK